MGDAGHRTAPFPQDHRWLWNLQASEFRVATLFFALPLTTYYMATIDDYGLQIHTEHEDAVAPGTEVLYDTSGIYGNLQHRNHGDGHVLLVPQPSLRDPTDPLRWPSWKKWMTFSNALAYSFLGGVTGPIMAGGILNLAAAFYEPV